MFIQNMQIEHGFLISIYKLFAQHNIEMKILRKQYNNEAWKKK